MASTENEGSEAKPQLCPRCHGAQREPCCWPHLRRCVGWVGQGPGEGQHSRLEQRLQIAVSMVLQRLRVLTSLGSRACLGLSSHVGVDRLRPSGGGSPRG